MGRVKEQLLDEEKWVEEEQEKIMRRKMAEDTFLYADLFDFNEVDKSKYIVIKLKGDERTYIVPTEDIEEITGVDIKYNIKETSLLEEMPRKLRVIPFMNILYIEYIYDE